MMNRRPLNSDQLGKKGEARFQELCVDAGLVPNPASWDRRGWDYIVQWPHMDTDVSLDVRPAPLACFVQNKTLWTGNGSIKAPLSSLEHIAKDPKPAFIYVLEVDNELRLTGAHALHIEGGLLGLILERLRRAQIEGDPPNRIEVKLNLGRWGRPIEPTGAAFRAFVEDAIGPSLHDCMERKLRELRTLGFEKGRLTLRTTFQGHTVDQITDAFLGVGRLEVVRAEAAETRFGMEVPLPALDFGPGEMELSPKAKSA